jgi:K+-transporting ATPase ATPase B chain
MSTKAKTFSLLDRPILRQAVVDAFVKLNPLHLVKNPVMFVVEVGCILTTLLCFQGLFSHSEEKLSFIIAVNLWLWFTLLFANFAEAVAEGRGKAQARSLKGTRKDVMAKLLQEPERNALATVVSGSQLQKGDLVLVEAGETIPGDGEVTVGVASVDESAITGESAPVIRESGGDRSAVTGGTRVLSDWLIVRITASPGETFLDKMIAMVEGAKRQKTPNEIALDILLADSP